MRSLIYILFLVGAALWWLPASAAGQRSLGATVDDGSALECDSTATTGDLLASAREMFVVDNYALAEMLYRCVLWREPANLSAILELSVVYETQGKLQYACGLLTRAVALRPFDEEIIERRRDLADKLSRTLESDIDALFTRGAYEAALPKLSVLLNERPDDAELHYKKARCYLELGDAAGALVQIDKAIGIQKDIRYSELRTEALKLDQSKDVDALVREARAFLTPGGTYDRDRALAVLTQILTRDPAHDWAKRQFVTLSGGRTALAIDESRPAEPSRLAAYTSNAARDARFFAGGVLTTVERHLPLLIAALVLIIAFASPLTSILVRGFEPRQSLSGRLNEFHIQEIFSLIHSQARNGVLRVYSGAVKARVYFVEGEIHHCRSGRAAGREAVRRVLTRANEGYFVLTKLPRTFKRTIDTPFSLVLMDIGDKSFLEPRPADSQPSIGPQKKSRMKSLLEDKP